MCVLGYRLLDSSALPMHEAEGLLGRLSAYEKAVVGEPGATPHARRWVISNAYMAGLLLLAMGRRAEARAEFQRCAAMDVLEFSPLLASKTIDASYHAGLIAACDGDVDGAATDFRRGLAELVRVLAAGDWANIIGSIDEPLTFGLVDLQQGVELASRCAFGLASARLLRDRPGLAWTLLRRRALADLKRWSEQQATSIEWLREQRREFERALGESREWVAQQGRAREWHEQNAAALAARLEALARAAGEERERFQALTADQKRAAEWHAAQKREFDARLRERDATIDQLRAAAEAKKTAEAWLIEQKSALEASLKERDARIADLQAKVAKLMEGRDWLLKRAGEFKAPAEPKSLS